MDYFTAKNAPEGSADRSLDCKFADTCVYSAKKIYITDRAEKGNLQWPCDIVVNDPTVEKICRALKTSEYGKCVYKCDNNAVDHQVVNIKFKNNSTAQLTMTAFSQDCYREIHVHCENGEIFGKESFVVDANIESDTAYRHGGDVEMINEIINFYEGKKVENVTSIDKSMQSHYMGFAA